MKICNVCGSSKGLEDYYNSKAEKDGKCHTCKNCAKNRSRRWAKDNIERANLASAKWARSNLQKRKAARAKWITNNSTTWQAIKRSKESRRRGTNKLATPKWLTCQHRAEIIELYTVASELQWLSNETLHVDHIVPLKNKEVCGLHVPWNLQILPAGENIRKSNSYEKA